MTQNHTTAVLKPFHYDLVIHAEDAAQADRVMVERIGYDEDLREQGVSTYKIDADPAGGRELAPVEVDETEAGTPRFPAVISTDGELTSINAEQYLTALRINKIMNSGSPLPTARSVRDDSGKTLVELAYGAVRLCLDEDGELCSIKMFTVGELTDLEGGALHRMIADALSAEPAED